MLTVKQQDRRFTNSVGKYSTLLSESIAALRYDLGSRKNDFFAQNIDISSRGCAPSVPVVTPGMPLCALPVYLGIRWTCASQSASLMMDVRPAYLTLSSSRCFLMSGTAARV